MSEQIKATVSAFAGWLDSRRNRDYDNGHSYVISQIRHSGHYHTIKGQELDDLVAAFVFEMTKDENVLSVLRAKRREPTFRRRALAALEMVGDTPKDGG